MRFAITATDRYLGVFQAFVLAGWQPAKLFTVPIVQPNLESNHAVIAYAEQQGVPIQMSRMNDDDMADLQRRGCQTLVVAGYKWRIGAWERYLDHAVNFHASPLPEGRGPYPSVRAILEHRTSWAVTCHKVAPKFDRGDILAARSFPLSTEECHESLELKTQIAARRLATMVADDFTSLWNAARPQGPGSYWPLWRKIDKAINFDNPVDAILRHVRAFGLLESLAFVNQRWLTVRRAVGWQEANGIAPGTVVHLHHRTIVVAAQDGFIGLIEWQFVDDDTVAELSMGG